MFFDAAKTEGAIGAVVPPKAPQGPSQSQHLSPDQFPKPGGGAEGGAAEGAAGAGEAAGGAELADLAILAV